MVVQERSDAFRCKYPTNHTSKLFLQKGNVSGKRSSFYIKSFNYKYLIVVLENFQRLSLVT